MGYLFAGSRIRYVATWNETGVVLWTSGVSDILAQVAAELNNNFSCRVERSNVQAPSIAFGSITETITLDLFTTIDRNDSADLAGNVDDAFARYGSRPDSSDIVSVTPPASTPGAVGTPQATGAPGPIPSNPSGTDWWQQLKTNIGFGATGFAVGGLVVVGLLVWIAVERP